MEKIFKLFWKTKAQRYTDDPAFVDVNLYTEQFETFAQLVNKGKPLVSVGYSLNRTGFVGDELYLPALALWTKDKKTNIDLYKLLIIQSCAIRELNISYVFENSERINPRLYVLSKMHLINRYLDENYSGFKDFQANIVSKYYSEIRSEFYFDSRRGSLIDFWKKHIITRDAPNETEVRRILNFYKKKRNEEVPSFLHSTIALPLDTLIFSDKFSDEVQASEKKQSDNHLSEKSRKRKEKKQRKDEKKAGEKNPVMHSFEKIEAVDDYDGANRIDDGEDELDSHSDALDEIEMNNFTLDGKTNSIYRQDYVGSVETIKKDQISSGTATSYSEWNYKSQEYIKNYCHIKHEHLIPVAAPNEQKLNIKTKFAVEVAAVRKLLKKIQRVPEWRRRLKDGSELDIDAIARLYFNKKATDSNLKIYTKKILPQKNIAIAVVIDTSMSTDSYVDGKKIIDVIKNSLGVFAYGLSYILDEVLIATSSSKTRRQIDFNVLKDFDQDWDAFFGCLEQVKANEYTRLGPSIRHACALLKTRHCRHKVLYLITDGKPTDLDYYEGQYGQEDVRMACREAQNLGVEISALTYSDIDHKVLNKIFGRYFPFSEPISFAKQFITPITKLK